MVKIFFFAVPFSFQIVKSILSLDIGPEAIKKITGVSVRVRTYKRLYRNPRKRAKCLKFLRFVMPTFERAEK